MNVMIVDDIDNDDPIAVVEDLALQFGWEYELKDDDEIYLEINGQWTTYSCTLVWLMADQTFRLMCSFELKLPGCGAHSIYKVINDINQLVWSGSFIYCIEHELIIWRYGLIVDDDQLPTKDQIHQMIAAAVTYAERFYQVFQLVAAGTSSHDALQVAIEQRVIGRA